jgi:saccharopine dehydrogenase (NAD+, L-lysine-forming)
MPDRDLDVVLYGATGYTGRLVARDLADQGADFAVAGRSRERLEGLADELDADPAVIVASVDDEDALEAMAERARTVASAAGPFKHLGPPVFDAALGAGAHVVDTTGEQGYLRWAHDQHERAREAGVAVVNATGFDVVPSDLAARTAADAIGDPDQVDLALATNSRLSGGTQRTMAATTGDWWIYQEGAFRSAVPGRHLRSFAFEDTERTGVFIPWGDVATAPRSTGADTVRTFFVLPESQARKYHWSWPLQWVVAKVPGLEKLLEARAPDDRDGPSEGGRAESWFTILAEAKRGDETVRAVVEGTDPYGLTGAATSRTALALADGDVEPGVHTPTQALGTERIPKLVPDFVEPARVLDDPA